MLYWSWSAHNSIGERETKTMTIFCWEDVIELGRIMTMGALAQGASCNAAIWGEIRDEKVHSLHKDWGGNIGKVIRMRIGNGK